MDTIIFGSEEYNALLEEAKKVDGITIHQKPVISNVRLEGTLNNSLSNITFKSCEIAVSSEDVILTDVSFDSCKIENLDINSYQNITNVSILYCDVKGSIKIDTTRRISNLKISDSKGVSLEIDAHKINHIHIENSKMKLLSLISSSTCKHFTIFESTIKEIKTDINKFSKLLVEKSKIGKSDLSDKKFNKCVFKKSNLKSVNFKSSFFFRCKFKKCEVKDLTSCMMMDTKIKIK